MAMLRELGGTWQKSKSKKDASMKTPISQVNNFFITAVPQSNFKIIGKAKKRDEYLIL
jgi:hypothetical protein